jgi:hypothetical protein
MPLPRLAKDPTRFEERRDMICKIRELARAARGRLAFPPSAEKINVGDCPHERQNRAPTQREAECEDSIGIEAIREETAAAQSIEDGRQVARPLPPAQESFGAIGLDLGIAVVVHANDDESLCGQATPKPAKVGRRTACSMRQ